MYFGSMVAPSRMARTAELESYYMFTRFGIAPLTSMYQTKLLAHEELLLVHAHVLLEECVQDSVVEMIPSDLQAFSTRWMLLIELIKFIVKKFNTSVFGNVTGFIEIMVTLKEEFSPAAHDCLLSEMESVRGEVGDFLGVAR
jgi:hypothetical protein